MNKREKIIEGIRKILRDNSNYPIEHKKYKLFYEIYHFMEFIMMYEHVDEFSFRITENFDIELSVTINRISKDKFFIEDEIAKRKSKLNSIKDEEE